VDLEVRTLHAFMSEGIPYSLLYHWKQDHSITIRFLIILEQSGPSVWGLAPKSYYETEERYRSSIAQDDIYWEDRSTVLAGSKTSGFQQFESGGS
jgi:hypothetical protein